jgi:hypothetical protein
MSAKNWGNNMTGRSGVRLAVGVLAAFAAGCGSSRPFTQSNIVARAADKNPPGPVDNRYGPPPGPAAASSWPTATERPAPAPGSSWPAADVIGPGQPTGQPALPPSMTRPAYYGGGYDQGVIPADPNVRQRPTATGGVFELGPHETAMDRAVELARKIEQVNQENIALLGRIRELEATAAARQTALNETVRDVQIASDEVTRTRAELQAVRKDLAALKTRVLQVEKDETETLKAVIAAIEKMLQQGPDNNGSGIKK